MYTILQQRFPNRDFFRKSQTLKKLEDVFEGDGDVTYTGRQTS